MPVHLFIKRIPKTTQMFIQQAMNYETDYEGNYVRENMFSHFQ